MANRSRRGIVLVLAAMFLAGTALALAMAIDASQKFLAWKMLRTRAEAAAMAAALELDGMPESRPRALAAAREAAGVSAEKLRLRIEQPGEAVVQLSENGVGVAAAAHQRKNPDPLRPARYLTLAAPQPAGRGFGLAVGATYQAAGEAQIGDVVPVQVHSGLPKEVPLTWIAGRVRSSNGGQVTVESLGGYLRGTGHAAVQPDGWWEVVLGPEVTK